MADALSRRCRLAEERRAECEAELASSLAREAAGRQAAARAEELEAKVGGERREKGGRRGGEGWLAALVALL